MINTIAALQGLYVALGGDIGDVANINTIPDMLEAVASVAGGAGGALPAVTSEDNGDILGVVEGAWAKRDPELPAVNGDDNGKILGVNNGAWGTVAAPLPTVAAEDIGDVLTVVSDGESGAQWGKGAIPQEVVILDATYNASSTNLFLSNSVTAQDVVDYIENQNKYVIIRVDTLGFMTCCKKTSIDATTNQYQFINFQVINNAGTIELHTYGLNLNKNTTFPISISEFVNKSAT